MGPTAKLLRTLGLHCLLRVCGWKMWTVSFLLRLPCLCSAIRDPSPSETEARMNTPSLQLPWLGFSIPALRMTNSESPLAGCGTPAFPGPGTRLVRAHTPPSRVYSAHTADIGRTGTGLRRSSVLTMCVPWEKVHS